MAAIYIYIYIYVYIYILKNKLIKLRWDGWVARMEELRRGYKIVVG